MSNIAGKAYAMTVITPIRRYTAWLNRLFFRVAPLIPSKLAGLVALSLIHYARWVVIGPRQFPHLAADQPEEDLRYAYMLFFSNFNGSWDQYVDSFSFAIPAGLDMFWKWNVRYPKSIPLTPFHQYIKFNQLEATHYYNAYPLATSNDLKSACHVRSALIAFQRGADADADDSAFATRYRALLRSLQHDLGDLYPTPIVSMSAYQVERRARWHARQSHDEPSSSSSPAPDARSHVG
jgi:hypothetical protein